MTPLLAPDITGDEAEAAERAEVIASAWETYRRSQQVPMPMVGAGIVMRAQSRLFRLTEPFASGRAADGGADLDGIREAQGDLTAAVRRYCGDDEAAFAAGTGEKL